MLATAVGERARADLLFALFTREAEIEPALPFNPIRRRARRVVVTVPG
jgi:hypothetical protein